MDWTAGYASDIEYTAGFYGEQSPFHLNLACALNGVEPVPLDRPFTYCELGFGRGLTANVLAAAYPNGQFYAADFNPAHVAGARALADSASLPNLTLLEASFATLAQAPEQSLPMFDFITLHGIYTWVTAENRAHIVSFINRYLKPGGVVYLSYNAMPGWSLALPLQRLLVEYGDTHPGRSDVQVAEAAQLVKKMTDLKAAYFTNPGLAPRLTNLAQANRNYLVHEYMHHHWQPLYHADVARDLADAKLDFVASADLPFSYHGLYLSQEKQDLLNTFTGSSMRETAKDYLLNTAFRKDVFVRGMRRMSPTRALEWLDQLHALLLVPRDKVELEMKLPIGTLTGTPFYEQVCDALAAGPLSMAQLRQLPAFAAQSPGALLQVLVLLSHVRQVALYHGDRRTQDAAPAQRLNRALAVQVRYNDDYPALCSPLLGTGVAVSYVDRVVFGMAQEQGQLPALEVVVRHVTDFAARQGRRMTRDGAALSNDADNQAEIRRQVLEAVELKLPLWRTLDML